VLLLVTRHRLIAEGYDKRKITRAGANVKLVELGKEITTELQRRQAMREQTKAAADNAEASARIQRQQEQAFQQQQERATQQADEARRQREFECGMQMLQTRSYGPPSTNTTCQWVGAQRQCHTQ
jgi:uncharacterized membrane protein YccC